MWKNLVHPFLLPSFNNLELLNITYKKVTILQISVFPNDTLPISIFVNYINPEVRIPLIEDATLCDV